MRANDERGRNSSPRTSIRPGRAVSQRQRDRTDRPNVRRDVLAADAVASRGAAHEPAVLVGQRDTQAVNFQLGDVRHRRIAEPAPLAHALIERAQFRPRCRRCRG